MAWVLLAAFSQIYSAHWKQKADQRNLSYYPEGNVCKAGEGRGMSAKVINTIKKKPSIVYVQE